MLVHDSARLIYLAHPRTASVATAQALSRVGFRQVGHDRHAGPPPGFDASGWTVFATVRNHWDAAVSWAFSRFRPRGGPPDASVATFEYALATRWIWKDRMWGLHGQSADALLRYEALSADLEAVLSERGVDMPGLPRANVSDARDGRHYAEFYDDDSRLYIAERFAGEIAELGYSFGTEACVAG